MLRYRVYHPLSLVSSHSREEKPKTNTWLKHHYTQQVRNQKRNTRRRLKTIYMCVCVCCYSSHRGIPYCVSSRLCFINSNSSGFSPVLCVDQQKMSWFSEFGRRWIDLQGSWVVSEIRISQRFLLSFPSLFFFVSSTPAEKSELHFFSGH